LLLDVVETRDDARGDAGIAAPATAAPPDTLTPAGLPPRTISAEVRD
jgi:hypothetical protein